MKKREFGTIKSYGGPHGTQAFVWFRTNANGPCDGASFVEPTWKLALQAAIDDAHERQAKGAA
jgi:hypothetical protein